MDLKSSVEKQGETVTQIITFIGGSKKTIEGVITETITQGQFTKFMTKDGRYIMVNDSNVLCVEVFKDAKANR